VRSWRLRPCRLVGADLPRKTAALIAFAAVPSRFKKGPEVERSARLELCAVQPALPALPVSSLGLFKVYLPVRYLDLDLVSPRGPAAWWRALPAPFESAFSCLEPAPTPSRRPSSDVSLVRRVLAITAKPPVPIRCRRFPRSTVRHEPRCQSVRASSARLYPSTTASSFFAYPYRPAGSCPSPLLCGALSSKAFYFPLLFHAYISPRPGCTSPFMRQPPLSQMQA
jgi:hypothetical protein